MTGKLGVLIHGAGWVAGQHAAAFTNHPATEVVAVSSRHKDSADRLVRERGLTAATFDDLAAALAHPGVDIVCVCTPQHVHCGNVLAAAAAGKHLVIEKPAAISRDELRQMCRAVEEAGVRTVVSFVLRWNPMFQAIKEHLAAGDLGEIYCVETDYLSYNADWWGGWEDGRRADTGVSAMTVAGCHAVDALRWFAASGEFEAAEPVEVFAWSGGRRKGATRQFNPLKDAWHEGSPLEYDGLEMVLVRFSNGVLGKVSVNFECIQPYAFPLRVFGDRGTVRDNRLYAPGQPGHHGWSEIPGVRPDSSDVTHHPFQAQADHFIDCLLRGVESHCNLADAAKTHEVVFAALECYRTGRPVKLPLA
ncbi:MAG: Gfo/Idh/MocA family oxidoreductase [Akkermansiaceae bacterium]|jgi:predicted dehydrogenase|nr:Gfo/Idh/MocA family oxidoreductase [Akkermansiaceae bacterium]